MKQKDLTINWNIQREKEQLFSSNFCLSAPSDKVSIPLILITDLQEKLELLHLLRTPHHIPKDPMELVRFIEKIRGITNELR